MADRSIFIPQNPNKYLGNNLQRIELKSSWERSFALFLDNSPAVLGWAYEALPTKTLHESGIAYLNPFTGRQTIYRPDFFVIYVDRDNKKHAEVIEIKPIDEVPPAISGIHTKTLTKLKEARQILNAAKFAAAVEHCVKRGWRFRIVTEKELFKSPTKSPTKRRR